MKHNFYDRILFNKVKYALGLDEVRLMISGSAPLSETVAMFFRCLLGEPVIEGYGQTEGTGISCLADISDMAAFGLVGGPANTSEMVLFDVPEMGYYKTESRYLTSWYTLLRKRGNLYSRSECVYGVLQGSNQNKQNH